MTATIGTLVPDENQTPKAFYRLNEKGKQLEEEKIEEAAAYLSSLQNTSHPFYLRAGWSSEVKLQC